MASLIASSPSSLPPIPPALPAAVNTELLLILAAFFFFLVCVFTGVALAVRNAWLNPSDTRPPPPPLKKKNLDSLPTVNIKPGLKQLADDHQECPICLAPFAHGDKIRVLPQCSHVFHASCVDTWLVSRSSCPTCRTVIMVVVPSTGTSSVDKEAEHVVSSRSRQCCFSKCFLPV